MFFAIIAEAVRRYFRLRRRLRQQNRELQEMLSMLTEAKCAQGKYENDLYEFVNSGVKTYHPHDEEKITKLEAARDKAIGRVMSLEVHLEKLRDMHARSNEAAEQVQLPAMSQVIAF